MKKLVSIFILICLIFTFVMPFGTNAAISNKKAVVPYLGDNTVKLDAIKESVYNECEQSINEQNLFRFPNSPKKTSGKFYLTYNKSYIYLYVDITDPNIDYSYNNPSQTWNRDSIGIILDFSYTRVDNYRYNGQENIAYVNLSGDNVMVTYHKYSKEGYSTNYNKIGRKTVSNTGNGHILYEIALPFPKGYTVQGGKKIGFEVSAIDAQSGNRVGHISWSEQGSLMDERLDVIGTIVLGDIPGEESVSEESSTPNSSTSKPTSSTSKPTSSSSSSSSGTTSDSGSDNTSTDTSSDNTSGDNDFFYTGSDTEDTKSDADTDKENSKGKDKNKDKDKNNKNEESESEDINDTYTTGTVDDNSDKDDGFGKLFSSESSASSNSLTVVIIIFAAILGVGIVAGVIVSIIAKKKAKNTIDTETEKETSTDF